MRVSRAFANVFGTFTPMMFAPVSRPVLLFAGADFGPPLTPLGSPLRERVLVLDTVFLDRFIHNPRFRGLHRGMAPGSSHNRALYPNALADRHASTEERQRPTVLPDEIDSSSEISSKNLALIFTKPRKASQITRAVPHCSVGRALSTSSYLCND